MKKIKNAMAEMGEYNCFGCSPNNPIGLKMQFYEDGDKIVSFFDPKSYYDGWDGIMHGGIIATMLDEIGEWLVFTRLSTTAVTTKLDVVYRKSVHTGKGKIKIIGRIIEVKRRIAFVDAKITDSDNIICAEASIQYFVYPKEKAEKDFNFPGKDAFYENT